MKYQIALVLLAGVAISRAAFAQENFGAEFDAFKTQYDARVKTDVQQVYEVGVADLNVKYLASLDRALDSAMKGGKLEDAVALKAEKETIKAGEEVPDSNDGKTPPSLVQLRDVYRTSMKRLEADRTKRLQPLQDNFARSLDGVVTHLMKDGKLTEAVALKKYRENLASAPPKGRILTAEQLTARPWKTRSAVAMRTWTFKPDKTMTSSSGSIGSWAINGNVLQVILAKTSGEYSLEVHHSGGDIVLKGKGVDLNVSPEPVEAMLTQSPK